MIGRSVVFLALLAAPAAAELGFLPCTEPGQEQFECATVTVPVDRSGQVPGTIDLLVQRFGPSSTLPVLVALSGGPGGSATSVAPLFARIFESVLDRYQLIVFDQRGTGLSGALNCPSLSDGWSSGEIAACASGLGVAAQFYSTADSVLDIDAVRAALGVETIVLAGISYGTLVTLEYARTLPHAVSAIVIDSIVPPNGESAFDLETFAAVPRVLRELCSGDACRSVTSDVVADTARLANRLKGGLHGRVVTYGGSTETRDLDASDLLRMLVAGDFSAALRAFYPGAVASALDGDLAPLFRLAELADSAELAPRPAADAGLREHSIALQYATACADIAFPWLASDTVEVRTQQASAALNAIPAAAISPFNQDGLRGFGYFRPCLYWPYTSLPRARSSAALPDIPALLLEGSQDLRTPMEDGARVAALLPQASRVVVPFQGHSVLTGVSCARTALRRFLSGELVDDPCASRGRAYGIEPRPVKKIAQFPRLTAVRGVRGRIVLSVLATLRDAFLASYAARRSVVELGGLRGGYAQGEIGANGFQLLLYRYAYTRRVKVSGSMTSSAAEGFRADVTVAGRMRGDLHFGPTGAIDGTLARRAVHVPPASLSPMVAGFGEDAEALPPIR